MSSPPPAAIILHQSLLLVEKLVDAQSSIYLQTNKTPLRVYIQQQLLLFAYCKSSACCPVPTATQQAQHQLGSSVIPCPADTQLLTLNRR